MRNVLKSKRTFIISSAVFICAVLGGIYWLYERGKTDTQRVIESVARHYNMPKNEEPAVLTVLEAKNITSSYLKDVAQDGDRILLYQKNKRVVVYRPSIDRIVDIGPVVIDSVE